MDAYAAHHAGAWVYNFISNCRPPPEGGKSSLGPVPEELATWWPASADPWLPPDMPLAEAPPKKNCQHQVLPRKVLVDPGSQLKPNQKLSSSLCSSVYLQSFWVSKTPRRGQWAVNQFKGFQWLPKPQECRLRAVLQPHIVLEVSHSSIPDCFTLIIQEQKAKFSLLFF